MLHDMHDGEPIPPQLLEPKARTTPMILIFYCPCGIYFTRKALLGDKLPCPNCGNPRVKPKTTM